MPGPIGLSDFMDDFDVVDIGRGHQLEIRGITINDVFRLMKRFPVIQGLLSRQGMTAANLFDDAPESIAAVIAASCGKLGDEVAERNASRLPLSAQIAALDAIGRLTFTQGFGPFVNQLTTLFQLFGAPVGNGLDTTSPREHEPLSEPELDPPRSDA
jgi:hypothetical protein